MSINGLDYSDVVQAREAALTEVGGWLLLSYTSRDDVALHSTGTGGAPELQTALAKWSEKSPLYGFLLFRRRRVVVKYVPEGTSRLIQARTTVHFQTVLDHFSPYDASFSVSSPDELSESALSAGCSLHTASISSRSSRQGSLTRQHLDEIREDTEPPSNKKPVVSDTLTRIQDDEPISSYSFPAPPTTSPQKTSSPKRDILAVDRPNTARTIEPAPELPAESPSDRDSIDELLGIPRKTPKSMDLKEALALDIGDLSDSENFAMRSRSYEGKGPDANSTRFGSVTSRDDDGPGSGRWKPKIKMFTRTIEDTKAELLPDRERVKLPNGIHIRRESEEAALKKERERSIKSEKSSRRPRSSKSRRKESRSGDAGKVSKNASVDELALVNGSTNQEPRSRPTTARKLSSKSQAHLQRTAQEVAANVIGSPLTVANGQPPEVVNSETRDALPVEKVTPQASVPAPVPAITPERQRLLRALELRKRQEQEATGAAQNVGVENKVPEIPAQFLNGVNKASTHSPKASVETSIIGPVLPPPSKQAIDTPATMPNGSVTGPTATERVARKKSTDAVGKEYFGATGATPKSPKSARARSRSKSRHRAKPPPLEIPNTAHTDGSISDTLSDGSYMDDLQNATVHEAMRVSIPNTPMTPSVTNGTPTGASLERRESLRSAQSALYKSATRQSGSGEKSPLETVPAGEAIPPPTMVNIRKQASYSKKSNVSSGISLRIQALEERSQRSSSPVSTAGGRSPLMLQDGFLGAPQNHGRTMSITSSRPSSRAGSRFGTARSLFNRSAKPMESIHDVVMSPDQSINEHNATVSFTAHIVRDANKTQQSTNMGPPPRVSAFPKSRITVDPTSGSNDPIVPTLTTDKRFANRVPAPVERSSSRGSAMSSMARSSVDFGMKFIGRSSSKRDTKSPSRKSDNTATSLEAVREDEVFSEPPPPPPPAPVPAPVAVPVQQIQEPHSQPQETTSPSLEKKPSKTGGFFKRLSGLSSKSRRSGSVDRTNNPPPNLDSYQSRGLSTAKQAPRAATYLIGDLNVQFPDTLFWKRRWIEVDGTGNLVLAASRGNVKDSRTQPKMYHLSSFMAPVIPGPDRQELPYSIILDSFNGGTLQFASDDRVSQQQVLRRLQDAHKAWTS